MDKVAAGVVPGDQADDARIGDGLHIPIQQGMGSQGLVAGKIRPGKIDPLLAAGHDQAKGHRKQKGTGGPAGIGWRFKSKFLHFRGL